MRDADEHIKKILAAHGEDFETNTWLLPGGKSRAIKHHCTERMAAKMGIRFLPPDIISSAPDNVVIIVKGRMADEEEVWSFGEAAPKNNKNAYPYAIAEKRAKGRVALKLLGLHGLLHDETEMDGAEQAVPVKSSRQAKKEEIWPSIEKDIAACQDTAGLLEWANAAQPVMRTLSLAWQEQAQEAWRSALTIKMAEELRTIWHFNQWAVDHEKAISALPQDWLVAMREVWRASLKDLKLYLAEHAELDREEAHV